MHTQAPLPVFAPPAPQIVLLPKAERTRLSREIPAWLRQSYADEEKDKSDKREAALEDHRRRLDRVFERGARFNTARDQKLHEIQGETTTEAYLMKECGASFQKEGSQLYVY